MTDEQALEIFKEIANGEFQTQNEKKLRDLLLYQHALIKTQQEKYNNLKASNDELVGAVKKLKKEFRQHGLSAQLFKILKSISLTNTSKENNAN